MTPDRRTRGYMPDSISVPRIGMAVCMVLLAIVLTFVAALAVLREGAQPQTRQPSAMPPMIVGSPRLETDPAAAIAAYRAQKALQLGSYGWIDRSRGIAHIPIERAMALRAEGAIAPERR
jgi:hypothetical protein